MASALVTLALAAPAAALTTSFTSAIGSPLTITKPGDVAAGDFNDDGLQDIAVTQTTTDVVTIRLGSGGGTYGPPANIPVGDFPERLAVTDLNNDDDEDLVVSNCGFACSTVAGNGSVSVILGTDLANDGTFAGAVSYVAGTAPQDVAVGDLDKDGDKDVVAPNQGSDDLSVLVNNGAGALAAPVNFGVGDQPQSAVVDDINEDGELDVFVTNSGTSNSLSLLLGSSPGAGFSGISSYPGHTGPDGIQTADFNGDGNKDLVIAERGNNQVAVRLGNGIGNFTAATNYGANAPTVPLVGDLNGDGKTDIAVPENGVNGVVVLLGEGDGDFVFDLGQPAPNGPEGGVLKDLNGDRRLDLAVASPTSDAVSVRLNGGPPGGNVYWMNDVPGPDAYIASAPLDGQAAVTRPLLADSHALAVDATHVYFAIGNAIGRANLDGSGVNPAFIAGLGSPARGIAVDGRHIYWSEGNAIRRANIDDGSGAQNVVTALVEQPFGLDVDDTHLFWAHNAGVGRADLDTFTPNPGFITGAGQTFGVAVNSTHVYYSNFGNGDIGRTLLDGTSPQDPYINGSATSGTYAVAVDDTHLYWTNQTEDTLGRALLNGTAVDQRFADADNPDALAVVPGRGFVGTTGPFTFAAGTGPRALAAADFDGDNDDDVVVANGGSDDVTVNENDGTGNFATSVDFGVGDDPRGVVAADFDRDGDKDIAATNFGNDNVAVLLNDGGGNFGLPTFFTADDGAWGIATDDFDEDGNPDLAVSNATEGNVTVLLGDGAGSFDAAASPIGGTDVRSIASGDLNGDGNRDLVLAEHGNDSVTALLGTGSGSFPTSDSVTTGNQPVAVAAGRLDGDGLDDVVALNEASETLSVLRTSGGSSPLPATPEDYSAGAVPAALTLGDFNGDSLLDVAAATSAAVDTIDVRLGNGTGTLGAIASLNAGDSPSALTPLDGNRDGKSDIAVANQGAGNMEVHYAFTALPGPPAVIGTDPDSPSSASSIDVEGTAEVDATVQVYSNSLCTVPVIGSFGTGAQFRAGLSTNVPFLEATTTFYAIQTDGQGNQSMCSRVGLEYTHDSVAPSEVMGVALAGSSAANDNNPEVTGAADSGTTVRIYSDVTCTTLAATGTAAQFNGAGITVPVPDDTTTSFRATSTDAASNESACSTTSATYTEDSTPPATPSFDTNPPGGNDNGPELNGATDANTTIDAFFNDTCSGSPVVTGPAGGGFGGGITVTVPDNSETLITVRARDAVNNVSGCSAPRLYKEDSTSPQPPPPPGDTTPPAPPTDLATNPPSPAHDTTPELSGDAEAGSTVAAYTTPDCSGPPVATASAADFAALGISVPVPPNQTTTLHATATDAASNTSACSAGIAYKEAAPPKPEPKETVNVDVKSGTVEVTCPDLPPANLQDTAQLPLGCTIDATKGVVTLAAADIEGKAQKADFFDGAFSVKQVTENEKVGKKKRKVLVTELKLDVAAPTDCKAKSKPIAAARRGGRLWGRGRGRYRTRGRRGAGTVRGTTWLTEERCEGTYFKVTKGFIDVRDFTRKKTVLVKTGKSYLAKAP